MQLYNPEEQDTENKPSPNGFVPFAAISFLVIWAVLIWLWNVS